MLYNRESQDKKQIIQDRKEKAQVLTTQCEGGQFLCKKIISFDYVFYNSTSQRRMKISYRPYIFHELIPMGYDIITRFIGSPTLKQMVTNYQRDLQKTNDESNIIILPQWLKFFPIVEQSLQVCHQLIPLTQGWTLPFSSAKCHYKIKLIL